MKTKSLLFIIAAFFLSSAALGQIIHVPGDKPTIQDGINFASAGDTVLVDEGTYYENIRFFGKAITVASNFILDGDTSHINNTIIDGSQPDDPDKGSVVIFMNGEDTTSIINGFTITQGTGLEIAGERMGGGIVCYQSGAKILNNKIVDNEISYTGVTPGGGICSFFEVGETWIVVENNIISSNGCISANGHAFGGGIAVATHARIVNNKIYNNNCTASATNKSTAGGGLYIDSPSSIVDSVHVISNEIYNNTLESYYSYGAGLYIASSFLYLGDNIINTNTNNGTQCYGSAIYIVNVDGDITIEGNTINKNTHRASKVGGATIWVSDIVNEQSLVTVKNNTINNNSAGGSGTNLWGTAVFLSDIENFEVTIESNLISNNTGKTAGAVYARNSYNYKLINNIFINNDATDFGGAIYERLYYPKKSNRYSSTKITADGNSSSEKQKFHPLIANNTFIGNHSGNLGGAVYLSDTYDSLCPVFINNIFKDNTADGMDYAVHHAGDEELLFSNNNIELDRIYGNWEGTGNISEDPLFLDDTLFLIDASSPCFNTGIDSVMHDGEYYTCPATDYQDDPRPSYGGVDIGADEFYVTGVEEPVVQNSMPEILNYPNPFSTSTTIAYELQHPSTVQITIYNYLGKQIEIIQRTQTAGKQQVVWNAEGLSSGVYFCVLKSNDGTKTTKMIKMK